METTETANPGRIDTDEFGPLEGPELVFAVTGAVGTNLSLLCKVISEALSEVRYSDAKTIRLSSLLRSFDRYQQIPESPLDERTIGLMDAGDELRSTFGRGDAMALLGVSAVQEERIRLTGDVQTPAPRQAYILHSLKRPDEVRTLRRIYGRAFYLIAAFSTRESRVASLAAAIAQSHHDFDHDSYRKVAEELVKRDEADLSKALGQDVRDTFPLADLFVDAANRDSIGKSVGRFIDLLFGHPFHTPTPDEFGMFHARASALRSADLSRQVGAAIVGKPGEIISLGYNDVPRPHGGHYWPGDDIDYRDFVLGYDPSARIKQEMVAEILHILQNNSWLSDDKTDEEIQTLVDEALSEDNDKGVLRHAQIMNILEFGRVVHAEMSAITEASRRGVSIREATLYCTTFPCHICARHIIASGISRMVYIEPYPKSMAQRLYPEAISIDRKMVSADMVKFEPFFGVSPARYLDLFEPPKKRRRENGDAVEWKRSSAEPRLERMVGSYLGIETLAMGVLRKGVAVFTERMGTAR
jgi:cytidine deaminase